jgi:hypothetical protein
VAEREQGRALPGGPARRAGVIGEFLPKLEELVERSKGKIRADKAHEHIAAMGYEGSERTTRRAAGPVASQDSTSAWVQAARAWPRPCSQVRKLAAARMLRRAWAV